MERGTRRLRGLKARVDGLTPKILVRFSVASRSFLVHKRKCNRPSTFQATQDMSGTENAVVQTSVKSRHHRTVEDHRGQTRSNQSLA